MNRILKTFLLWLLVAALPLQGMAAAIQASCGPAHHQSAQVPTADGHTHDQVVNGHSHGENNVLATVESLAGAQASADAPPPDLTIHNATCSACAACCVGATAPPAASLLTPAYSSSETVVISPSPLVASIVPAGLERPPKRLSA